MKDSIKRVQSQACLSYAERENLGPTAKEKIFMKSAGRRGYSPLVRVMTLAVMLLAMTTGAWAQDSWQSSSSQSSNTVTLTNIKVTFNGDWTFSDSGAQGSSNGQTITIAPTADGDFTLYTTDERTVF